jgi:hypothetical protein
MTAPAMHWLTWLLADAAEAHRLKQQLSMIPPLHSRAVVGWFTGSKAQFQDLLRAMKDEVGPQAVLPHSCMPCTRILT